MWQLHYHYDMTMQHQLLNVYTLRKNNNGTFMIVAIPEKQKDLKNQLQLAMNGMMDWPQDEHFSKLLDKMFYGPWYVDSLQDGGERWCKITEAEHTKLKYALFREAAERRMAEAMLKNLQKDFTTLQRAYETQAAQLLRAQANARIEPLEIERDTQTQDMFEPEQELLQLSFQHHLQVLCPVGGCGEV